MKKAFMRGVCALNMEAMSMFKEEQPAATEASHAMFESTNRLPYPSATQTATEKFSTVSNSSSAEGICKISTFVFSLLDILLICIMWKNICCE